jgi:hypothetical protein
MALCRGHPASSFPAFSRVQEHGARCPWSAACDNRPSQAPIVRQRATQPQESTRRTMPRKNPPRNPHGYLDEEKMRAQLGLPPLNPQGTRRRRMPKVIVMKQHKIERAKDTSPSARSARGSTQRWTDQSRMPDPLR